MLRAALALLSTLQIGARIKQSFERSLRQAAVIAVAAVFVAAAAVFGLIAAYHVLVSIYQFDAVEAAAIMAGVLLFVGLIVIAIALSMGRSRSGSPSLAVRFGPRSHSHARPGRRQGHAAGRPRATPRHRLHRRRALRPPVALAAHPWAQALRRAGIPRQKWEPAFQILGAGEGSGWNLKGTAAPRTVSR